MDYLNIRQWEGKTKYGWPLPGAAKPFAKTGASHRKAAAACDDELSRVVGRPTFEVVKKIPDFPQLLREIRELRLKPLGFAGLRSTGKPLET